MIKTLNPGSNRQQTQRYYFLKDGLGSVAALTNSQGRIAESYSYDEYGKPLSGSLSGNRYLFTAREYDRETGLYYYRARYYDPGLGRFLQADPVGIDDENTYAYCYNSPVNYTDPFGLQAYYPGAGSERGIPYVGGLKPSPEFYKPGRDVLPGRYIPPQEETNTNICNKRRKVQQQGLSKGVFNQWPVHRPPPPPRGNLPKPPRGPSPPRDPGPWPKPPTWVPKPGNQLPPDPTDPTGGEGGQGLPPSGGDYPVPEDKTY